MSTERFTKKAKEQLITTGNQYNTDISNSEELEKLKTVKQEDKNSVNTKKPKKLKLSLYVTAKHVEMFNEMSSKRLKETGKQDKGQIICEAIEMLYKATS